MQKLIFTKDYELFDNSYKSGNFTLNSKSIFFWNHYQSWKMDLEEDSIGTSSLK